MGDATAAHYVYVDESGMDDRDDYGYSPNGWVSRWPINRAIYDAGVSCNRLVFETWLETCLIPGLKPGNIVVIDNASFHHGGRIEALIEAAGCKVMYLPPYSPDLNRIEKCWA